MNEQPESYRQLRRVSKAALLEESNHLKLIYRGVLLISVIVFALLIWASFAKIQEVALTYGELVPKGEVQWVQHLEGGIVLEVLVKDGDRVNVGQLLLKLDPTAAQSELSQLRGREISLTLDSERLNAYVKNQPADLLKWSNHVINSKYNTVKNKKQIEKLLEDERSLLHSQNNKRRDQIAILTIIIERQKEKLRQTTVQLEVWKRHIALLMQEFEMYKKLRKENLIAHKDYLVVLRDMNRSQGEKERLSSEILQTKQAIQEAEGKLKEMDSDFHEQALKELGQINSQLLLIRHKIEKLEAQIARTEVKAPVTGIIKGLTAHSGNVIQPGGKLLEVVPYGKELIAETRIKPHDIGYVKVGEPVTVKVLAYDYARYGSIQGKLSNISASTFLDDKGRPYYRATTTLSVQYIGGAKGMRKQLIPGMTVEANIATGEKTLMQYLLKPIQKTTEAAFKER